MDQVESILSRREVRGRRHLGPDGLPVELRPITTEVKPETPELEAEWPSDRPRCRPGTYDEVAQAGAAELPSEWKTLHRTVLPASWFTVQLMGSLSLHDGGALKFISMSERCAQQRVG